MRAINNMLALLKPVDQVVSLRNFRRGLAAMSQEVATGLNIEKKGSDPPLKADDELPGWLWPMAQPGKPLSELRRVSAAKGGELEFDDLIRMTKLENRDKIRTRNTNKAK